MRARRRLIGAAVLVVLAVIALPMVFESQPRPLDTSIAIVLPHKDAVQAPAPVAAPAPIPVPPPPPVPTLPDAPAQPLPQAAPPSSTAAIEASPPRQPAVTAPAPAAKPVMDNAAAEKAARERAARADRLAAEKAAEKAAERAAERAAAERAAAAAAAKAAADKAQAAAAKAESGTRFMVQVGAFAEAATVREARQRIEKLGLRATEQDVETAGGRRTRVRLGPFNSREEADRALAKLRAAGLPGAVVPL
ncbi:Sporulation domain protein [Leptothrix cholodnii SP-6]|uniref:Sporulation domain protein n=1 Tax=Leptothrix cholodnii (strain ATCC 51168 / LMG 8142 / SP-6) TaxID=395495 RepID=B1XY52_LEPCP|nr:Sporulation domain protein [Leptothrix cholodnii SP-6]